ncbi:general substrate transporter [Mycena maculata]|uniref:General substrate transporter n=1 Tax=Mycena maculata TaxID=230809 RepID=A0AAD7K8I3_9AGAR|nr:general substrate transporter [Mycena maculata]
MGPTLLKSLSRAMHPSESQNDCEQVVAVSNDMKRESHETMTAVGSSTQGSEAPRLSPTSLASFKLYLILLVPSMASICVGFDIAVMNYINGMESYLSYFDLDGENSGGGVGTTTALIFGMYTLGTCLAVLVAGPVSDRFGRRGGMFAGGLFCMVGGIVVTVARDVKYLKAGRFLLGMSTALLEVAAPMFVVEISPPQWRGRLTGIYAAIAICGSIASGVVTTVTGRLNTSASWRIPLSIQIIPAGIVFFCSYLIPESPRWLMSVGRKEEARLILSRYHGNGDTNAPLVVLECKEFEESFKLDASRKSWWDYTGLFNTRSARYRTFMLLLMACCGQFSGSGLSYFLVVLLANDHISTQNLRLLLSLVSNIIAAIGGLCGAVISDRVGRRTLWFWGNVCCTIALIISGACTAKWGAGGDNPAGSNAAIAFFFLFNFLFCVTYLVLPAVYPSECMSFDNRANGVALYTFVASASSLVNTYATPIALANIQWRLYFVFIAWDAFASVLIWFFAVETSQRTLEELNEIFENRNPVRASRKPNERKSTILKLIPVGGSKAEALA